MNKSNKVIIYDGECAMCNLAVRWIRTHELTAAFEYLSCQSDDRKKRYPQIMTDDCMASLHLVTANGTIYTGAEALPIILTGMRKWRWLAYILRLPLIRHAAPHVYAQIAKHRQFISHKLGLIGRDNS